MTTKVVSFLALAITVPAYVLAQDTSTQLRYYQRHTSTVLRNAEKLISPHLTRGEKRSLRDVDVHVPADHAFVAQAYPGNIVISAGTSWILEQLAISHIADYELGFDGCDEDYTMYLAEIIVRNTDRVSRGTRPRMALPVVLYGREFGGGCRDVDPAVIGKSATGEYFARLMEASLVFLYLHEVAHHVLGHVDHVPDDLGYSRELEAEADAWAIGAGFRSDFNVLVGAPAMNLIAALGGASLEAEKKQTHPLGIRRVRDMLVQARDILENQGKDDVIEWLDDNLRRTESLMP